MRSSFSGFTVPPASYSFSLQHDRRIDDPHDEQQSFIFRVECLWPSRFKGRDAEANLCAYDSLTLGSDRRHLRPAEPILAVGSTQATNSRFDVGLPAARGLLAGVRGHVGGDNHLDDGERPVDHSGARLSELDLAQGAGVRSRRLSGLTCAPKQMVSGTKYRLRQRCVCGP